MTEWLFPKWDQFISVLISWIVGYACGKWIYPWMDKKFGL
jgi:hypothetical protein